eukprot:jgi/Bigna1/86193/estExt_fgenesh1_pg.C_80290
MAAQAAACPCSTRMALLSPPALAVIVIALATVIPRDKLRSQPQAHHLRHVAEEKQDSPLPFMAPPLPTGVGETEKEEEIGIRMMRITWDLAAEAGEGVGEEEEEEGEGEGEEGISKTGDMTGKVKMEDVTETTTEARDREREHRHNDERKFMGRRKQPKRSEMTEEEHVKYAFRQDATSAERKAKIAQWNRMRAKEKIQERKMEEAQSFIEAANFTTERLTRLGLSDLAEKSTIVPESVGVTSKVGPTTPGYTATVRLDAEDLNDPLAFLLDPDFKGPWIPDRKRMPGTGWDVPPDDPMGIVLPGLEGAQGDGDSKMGRIYIGNLPETNVYEIKSFFNKVMTDGQGWSRRDGNSVIQKVAFCERSSIVVASMRGADTPEMSCIIETAILRSMDLHLASPSVFSRSLLLFCRPCVMCMMAMQALELDGVYFKGIPVKVGRPVGFNAKLLEEKRKGQPPPAKLKVTVPRLGKKMDYIEPDYGPTRLKIEGIPKKLEEMHLRQLLEAFGLLQGLYYPRDEVADEEEFAWALCLYNDTNLNPVVIKGLNGLEVMEGKLVVRPAIPGRDFPAIPLNAQNLDLPTMMNLGKIDGRVVMPQPEIPGGDEGEGEEMVAGATLPKNYTHSESACVLANLAMDTQTRIVVLFHMATEDELKDDEEYNDIKEEIEEECAKYGMLKKVVIPRPNTEGGGGGVGKVFLEYVNEVVASKALQQIRGRRFGNNTVDGGFWPEEQWSIHKLDNLDKAYHENPQLENHDHTANSTQWPKSRVGSEDAIPNLTEKN